MFIVDALLLPDACKRSVMYLAQSRHLAAQMSTGAVHIDLFLSGLKWETFIVATDQVYDPDCSLGCNDLVFFWSKKINHPFSTCGSLLGDFFCREEKGFNPVKRKKKAGENR